LVYFFLFWYFVPRKIWQPWTRPLLANLEVGLALFRPVFALLLRRMWDRHLRQLHRHRAQGSPHLQVHRQQHVYKLHLLIGNMFGSYFHRYCLNSYFYRLVTCLTVTFTYKCIIHR
jgi:hypothetical protein